MRNMRELHPPEITSPSYHIYPSYHVINAYLVSLWYVPGTLVP